MSSFSVYRDNDNSNTFVSNIFIDEYMTEANAAQIKVYLYLLRMNGSSTSVSDMADRFNYTEKDICRALKYWEKNRLLLLDYDINGSVVGVKLLNPTAPMANAHPDIRSFIIQNNVVDSSRQAARNNSFQDVSVNQYAPALYSEDNFSVQTSETSGNASYMNSSTSDSEAESHFQKPEYSADELRAFKDREEIKQLMFVASQYLGKTLSPSDIKSLLFISDTLNFSEDLIDYLLAYCADKDKKSFRYIETVAINWANEGIKSPAQAKALNGKYDKSVYTVMRALGKNTNPTEKEADYVRRWTNEFGFSTDIILEACERCVMSTDKNRFAYADSILKNWRAAGVVVKSDIVSADTKAPRTKKGSNTTNFHRLDMKHNYDYSAMEEQLLRQN